MEQEPLFSKTISARTRVYYIDAHIDAKQQLYIVITEIIKTKKDVCKKKRHRIVIHAETLDQFVQAFVEVANHIKNGSQG